MSARSRGSGGLRRGPGLGPLPLAAILLIAGSARAETPLTTVRVAQGLARPVFVTAPPGDSTRLFIVEQRGADNRGRIKILKNGSVLARPFLTTAVLASGNEQGLLGLAFAPDYATTGRFYINYTRSDGTTEVVRHVVSADPDSANPAGTVILTVPQPFSNHNGGWLGFGPDGYLYVPLGDGGSAGDPGDRAQNLNTLLGKILRLDVSGAGYSIPPGNPFAGAVAGLDEIWAFGLRNPWRPSFDRATGDLVIADVGQSLFEEVNFQPAASGGGENYGWRCYEGDSLVSTSATTPCDTCVVPECPVVFPAHDYPHTLGRCSVTGGYVYRGCAIPDLKGTYFFADYCAARIYSGQFQDGALVGLRDRTAELAPGGGLSIGLITSFGEDANGEIYICDQGGEVFRIVPEAPVLEADMPALRVGTSSGDSLGASAVGNAFAPGIVPFADAGSRVRGVGYLKNAAIRGCTVVSETALTSKLRLGPFDLDLDAAVDPGNGTLTRRFVFTNRDAVARDLSYVDVIAPLLNGDADGATTSAPASGAGSATLVLYDSFAPTLYVEHFGSGSAGVLYSADVDSAAALAARVAADQPLTGRTAGGPAALGLALGFDFGSVAPAAAETVTVVTRLRDDAPTGVEGGPSDGPPGRRLSLNPVPFRSSLRMALRIGTPGRLVLEVFDVHGRRVRSLLSGHLEPGVHRFEWNGLTAGGEPAAAGIYFVRLRGDGWSEVRRAVRLR